MVDGVALRLHLPAQQALRAWPPVRFTKNECPRATQTRRKPECTKPHSALRSEVIIAFSRNVVQFSLSGQLANQTKNMKTPLALLGLTACIFLSGCAHEPAQTTTKPAEQPTPAPAATFTVATNGTAPMYYQWHFNGTNVGGVMNITNVTNQ
jgi:hypothetical protein